MSTLLRTRDHQYVRDFTNLPFAGFANQHTLTLDVGEWTAANPLRLLPARLHRVFLGEFHVCRVAVES